MKKFLITIALISSFVFAKAETLTITQLISLAKSTSISDVSSIASANGYKLTLKKSGVSGFEGRDVSDMTWGYNITYNNSTEEWFINDSHYSTIKLLYDNTNNRIETIVYTVSSFDDFQNLKNQISNYGYDLYKEDTKVFEEGVSYCYFNNSSMTAAIFVEYTINLFQIHIIYKRN